MKLTDQQLGKLLRTLASTQDTELNCDECLASVATYAEIQLSGKTPNEAIDKVQQHLDVCTDCQEEYHALLMAIRGIN